ncbi:hypothetical protein ETAA8_08600 [Anatilimnocola aggregata]|uniref:Peptidase C-terminal archaeal/bacterial domain-containing protein n=1 Tax=Anatilimnocola aggregata TaxID=2528021 RepID=A0A517Y6C2_9BACT|nr:hypothetical protein [Anatilimnocola aggregata]QDU25789.1 hypothetical protein ETAA8_08600 [Anatilimnocola aggregata]
MKHDVSIPFGLARSTTFSLQAGLLMLLIGLPAIAAAQLPTAQLTSLFPLGGKQGTTVEVTVAGADLDEAEKLVFNHPGITAQPKMAPLSELEKTARPMANLFVVQIAGDVPPGIYEARAVSRYGISNPRSFCVSNMQEETDAAGNNSPEKAVNLAAGTVVSGKVEAGQFDYFRLPMKKGERVILECLAQRIDSRLDPTLAVYGANGREFIRVRDSVGEDCVLDFTAPADGDYQVRLFDAIYGGGAEHFYRLSASAAAYIDFVFPPSAVPGSNGSFTLYGRNLPGGKPAEGLSLNGAPLQKLDVKIAVPGDEAALSQLPLAGAARPRQAWQTGFEFRQATPQGPSNPTVIYFAKAPVVAEAEPNNEPAKAQQVTVPCEYVGQFYPQRDVDWVQFEAKKGQQLMIEVMSHQLGLGSDPYFAVMRVTKNDKGEEEMRDIAQVDDPADRAQKIGSDYDTSTDDPSYRFTAPEDGQYRVLVRDQFGDGRKDPTYVYRLAIRPLEPDFKLLSIGAQPVASTGNNNNQGSPLSGLILRRGGSTLVNVTVNRQDDFKGDIEITAEGLPEGITCRAAAIGGEVSSAALVFTANEDAKPWAGMVKIVGKSKVGDKDVTRESRYGSMVWGSANRQQGLPEFRLLRSFQLSVADKETEAASIQVGEDKIWETSLGGNLEIPVSVIRRGDFKEAIKLTAVGLPNDLKPKEINLAADAKEGKFELQINQQNAKPGIYTFYMKGDTKQKYVRNPEAVTRATEEQKGIGETIKALADQVKQLTTAKDAAVKAVADAAKGVKDAEKGDDAAKKAAADKAKAADEAKVKAEAELKAAQDKAKQADDLKKQIDKRLDDAKKAAVPKDLNMALVSSPIKIKIASAPYTLSSAGPTTVKQAEKSQLVVKLDRLYGFADSVDLSFDAPAGVNGLAAGKITLKKDEGEAKFELSADKKVAPGEHTAMIRAKGKFNNMNVETSFPVVIKVEEAK